MILSILHTTTTLNWKPIYYFQPIDMTKKKMSCMNHFYNRRTKKFEKNFPGFDAMKSIVLNDSNSSQIPHTEARDRMRRILWKVK